MSEVFQVLGARPIFEVIGASENTLLVTGGGVQGPPGEGSSDPLTVATLDQVGEVAWPASLDIIAQPGVNPPGLSVTSAGVKYAFGPTGKLQAYPAGTLRDHYNPLTGEYLGNLIEAEARTNLWPWSQAPGNWTVLSDTTVTENYGEAPDGSETSARIEKTGAGATWAPYQQVTVAASTTYAFSVFLKNIDSQWVRIRLGLAGGTQETYVDLANLIIGYTTSGWSNLVFEQLKDGWVRLRGRVTTGAGDAGLTTLAISPSSEAGGASLTSIELWGIQFETGAFPSSYIPTHGTTVTRPAETVTQSIYGYIGGPKGTPGTNLIPQPEAFDNAAWIKTNLAVTPNSVAAPLAAGTVADTLTDDATNGVHRLIDDLTVTANADFVCSVFAKANTLSNLFLRVGNTAGTTAFASTFVLASATVLPAADSGTAVLKSVRIIPYPDGWYRCVVIGSLGGGITTARVELRLHNGSSTSYSGSGQSLYAWGAKLEEASALTPYNADDAGHWFNPDEGTIVAELGTPYGLEPQGRLLAFSDSTYSNGFELYDFAGTGASAAWRVDSGGAFQGVTSEQPVDVNARLRRVAIAYGGGQISVCVDGGAVHTEAMANLPSGIDLLRLGVDRAGNNGQAILLRTLRKLPHKFTSTQLQALTAGAA